MLLTLKSGSLRIARNYCDFLVLSDFSCCPLTYISDGIDKGYSCFSCLSSIVQFSRCSFRRLSEVFRSLFKCRSRQATYLLYHTFGCLSSLFSNFFQSFLDFRLLKRFAFIPSSSLSPDRLVWISLASHFFAKLYPLRLFSFPKLRRFSDL